MHSTIVLSKRKTQLIIFPLLLFMPIIGMAVDLVSPSLPAIARDLSLENQTAKNLISIYLLGYALGNFLIGFLSDAIGRQKLFRLSLFSLFVISILPIYFKTIEVLLITRFMQGFTLGAASLLTKTIFSDILPPKQLISLGVIMGMMWGLGPIIGPLIGGYLQYYFGWEANFYFFSSLGFVIFIITFFLIPETCYERHPFNFKTIKANIIEVLKNKKFQSLVYLMGLVYSLIIIFTTMGPFIFQNSFHYSAVQYGHISFWLGIIYLITTIFCRYLLNHFAVEKLLSFVIHVFVLLTILGFSISYFLPDNAALLILTSAVMYSACGFIFPMSMGKGISLFQHISGTASSVMFLINILITSFFSYICGFLQTQNITSLLALDTVLLLFCLLALKRLKD